MCILIDVCFWCCVKDTDDYDNNVSSGGGGGGQGLLDRAGRMTHTELGQPVNDKLVTSLLSIEEQDREKLDWPSDWRLPYSRPFNEVSVITDRVLLSSVGAINRDNVRRYGINCIVSVCHDTPVFKLKGIQFIRIPVQDSDQQNIGQYFDAISNRISAISGRYPTKTILIHCVFGRSRSATVVIAHLMKSQSISLMAAYDLVKSKRPIIGINNGFMRQLIQYEDQLFGRQLTNVEIIVEKNNDKTMINELIGKYQREGSF